MCATQPPTCHPWWADQSWVARAQQVCWARREEGRGIGRLREGGLVSPGLGLVRGLVGWWVEVVFGPG